LAPCMEKLTVSLRKTAQRRHCCRVLCQSKATQVLSRSALSQMEESGLDACNLLSERCTPLAEAIFTYQQRKPRVVPATGNVLLPFSLCEIATASSSCTHSYWSHAALAVCDDTVSGRVKLEVPLIRTFQVVVVARVL